MILLALVVSLQFQGTAAFDTWALTPSSCTKESRLVKSNIQDWMILAVSASGFVARIIILLQLSPLSSAKHFRFFCRFCFFSLTYCFGFMAPDYFLTLICFVSRDSRQLFSGKELWYTHSTKPPINTQQTDKISNYLLKTVEHLAALDISLRSCWRETGGGGFKCFYLHRWHLSYTKLK